MIPAAPVSGTTSPVVTPPYYARVTGGAVCQQSDLVEAQLLVEQWCNRTLSYGRYTERLYVDTRAMVYPSATPLDQAQPILVGKTDLSGTGSVQGYGVWVQPFVVLPVLPVFAGVLPPQTDVTYSGGWQPQGVTTGPTPQIPPVLARAICKVAWFILNPAVLAGRPGGATSVSAAGVTVGGDVSSMVVTDAQLRLDLARYRRPQARSF